MPRRGSGAKLPVYVNWYFPHFPFEPPWARATAMPPSKPASSERSEGGVLSIGQACAATGLSPRTVRYYEELGLLPGIRRREAGRRVFGPDEIERLRFIGRLKKLGLSLAEIKELSAIYALAGSTQAMLEHLEELLGQHLRDVEGRLGELGRLRDELAKYHEHVTARIDSGRAPEKGREPQ